MLGRCTVEVASDTRTVVSVITADFRRESFKLLTMYEHSAEYQAASLFPFYPPQIYTRPCLTSTCTRELVNFGQN